MTAPPPPSDHCAIHIVHDDDHDDDDDDDDDDHNAKTVFTAQCTMTIMTMILTFLIMFSKKKPVT